MPTPSLLAIGRLAVDGDLRTRISAAAQIHNKAFTDDLIHAVIVTDGVADQAVVTGITADHPYGVDSTAIADAAILAAVATYAPTIEEAP